MDKLFTGSGVNGIILTTVAVYVKAPQFKPYVVKTSATKSVNGVDRVRVGACHA